MPRETIPKLTAEEARRYLQGAAERLKLEFTEISGVAPTFLLLPAAAPRVLLHQTWHAEPGQVEAAAVDGAERLGLGAVVAGMEQAVSEAPAAGPFALIVAPSAGAGSRGLDQLLRERRDRLSAPAAYWIRIAPSAANAEERRRVFLGARGRLVIALRGGDANPYRVRDAIVGELRDQAYGPRPLDFELIRKLARRPGAVDLLEDALQPAAGAATRDGGAEAGGSPEGAAEERAARIRIALFEPRGTVAAPPVPHPDRPRAWLTFEIAEGMEPDAIAARVQQLAGEGGGSAELVERFPWDRASIHHPAVHALIELAKSGSAGAEIWPSSPWPTPSGLFSRALGTSLAEWGIPLPRGAAIRFPKPEEFDALAAEAADLLARASSQAT